MPRKQAQTRAETARRILDEADRPPVLAVRCVLHVHRGREDGPGDPCPCCGSRFAEIVRTREVDTLLIAPRKRVRQLRSETLDTLQFDAYAAQAAQVDLVLRCSDWTDAESGLSEEEILFDREPKAIILGGANRSGKTQLGINWLALRWFLRGGNNSLFRIYGPILKQCHIGMRKLVVGNDDAQAVIPPILVESHPTSIRTDNQEVVLADGSRVELMHARSGAHIKGEAVVDSLWVEVAECPADDVFPIVVARHATTGGQVALDSTPKRGHWLIDQVEQAKEYRDAHAKAIADGEDPPRRLTRAIQKPMSGNAWGNPEENAALRATVAASDPIMARREFDGEWIGRYGLMFEEAWDGEANVVDMLAPDLESLGLRDVTRQASRAVWGGSGVEWLVGIDINMRPHTQLMCKIWEHPAHPGQRGILVYEEQEVWHGNVDQAAHALTMAPREAPGRYLGAGVAIDANAAHSSQHPSHSGGRPFTAVEDYERWGFIVRTNLSVNGKPENPAIRDSYQLLRHLMRSYVGPSQQPIRRFLVNAVKAPHCIKAIENLQDRGDGKPIANSNTVADRYKGYTDCARYLAWLTHSQTVYGTQVRVY